MDDGLTIGKKPHKDAELKDYSAGDVIDACVAAEKVVHTDTGPVLVASPTLMDMELLCRQVVRIGDHDGPLSMVELGRLTGRDLTALQTAAKSLDLGAAAVAQQRGRNPGSQGSD